MWTATNRPKYDRDKLRYPSDLTDEEFGHLASIRFMLRKLCNPA